MKKAFLFLLLNFLLSNFAIAQLKRISEFQPISERMVQDFKNELKFTTKTDELRASKVVLSLLKNTILEPIDNL